MDQHAASPTPSVSNLVPVWEDAADGGGSFEPAVAATVVEQVVQGAGERRARGRAERSTVTPPKRFDPTDIPARPSAFNFSALEEREESWDDRRRGAIADVLASPGRDDDGMPVVDYDALHRRDIAKELLRARLVSIAEQREHRTAYEIVFILLAAAVAVLLAAPPLVQVLLAAHGVQA
jgi:hypothetical protein